MVNFLPSQATTTITVTVLDVATNLTISAPASVIQGQLFTISGQLTRADTGAALVGETILVSYNGQMRGSPVTDVQGAYTLNTLIPEAGSFTLMANFEGSTRPGLTLLPSQAPRGVGVSLLSEQVILALLAASVGLGLVVASRT